MIILLHCNFLSDIYYFTILSSNPNHFTIQATRNTHVFWRLLRKQTYFLKACSGNTHVFWRRVLETHMFLEACTHVRMISIRNFKYTCYWRPAHMSPFWKYWKRVCTYVQHPEILMDKSVHICPTSKNVDSNGCAYMFVCVEYY